MFPRIFKVGLWQTELCFCAAEPWYETLTGSMFVKQKQSTGSFEHSVELHDTSNVKYRYEEDNSEKRLR